MNQYHEKTASRTGAVFPFPEWIALEENNPKITVDNHVIMWYLTGKTRKGGMRHEKGTAWEQLEL